MCYGWGTASKYWSEIGVSEGGRSVSAKFSHSRGRPPRTIFAWIDRRVNALQLSNWQYSHKETLLQTFNLRAIFGGKCPFCIFEHPFRTLRGNVRCSSYAHWKAHSGLHISGNWTFLPGVTAEVLCVNIDWKSEGSYRSATI